MTRRLTEIPHDSDKGGYLAHYEQHFAPLAEEPIVLLELGVDRGASLYLWREYFPRATIVGLDENAIELSGDTGRIKLYQGKQEDPLLLERIARETAPGGFDIIIDDAAHIGAIAHASFATLLPLLKPRGIYAIEDWGTGYWGDWPDGKLFEPNHYAGMVGFIKDLVDLVGKSAITDEQHGRPPFRPPPLRRLEIYPGLVIALKR